MKRYSPIDTETRERINERITANYSDLDEEGVTINAMFVTSNEGPALMVGGYPALACVRATSQKERAAGMADVELLIQSATWAEMTPEQKDALLDHELHHLIIETDPETGDTKEDPQGRPKIKMRKHDYQMGWFTEIARRHGMNSPEVTQARLVFDNDGQALFPFIDAQLRLV